MTSIIRRSAFFDVPTHVDVGGQPILVRPFQLVVWVSIEARDRLTPRLPAILDTGFSLNFAVQEEHLRTWAGLAWSISLTTISCAIVRLHATRC